MRFVEGHLAPAPSADPAKRLMGIEFALTNGMLSGLDGHSRLIDAERYRDFSRLKGGPGPTATGGGAIPALDSPSAGPVVAAPTRMAPGSTVAYLRIPHFSPGVSGEVQRALVAATAASPKGFILDLRDNPGGFLEEGMKVADSFIRTGTLASVAAKKGQRRDTDARNDGYEPGGALVVLVNRKTGAASELVAAAIKNLGRGVVLGEPTAGAGSVMVVFEIPMAPAGEPVGLLLATARLLAAGGGEIEGTGVQPDVNRGWSEPHGDQDCLRQFASALIANAREPQRTTLLSMAKSLADQVVCGPAKLSR
jgi:C-terminal processing protease CtpA/Prc